MGSCVSGVSYLMTDKDVVKSKTRISRNCVENSAQYYEQCVLECVEALDDYLSVYNVACFSISAVQWDRTLNKERGEAERVKERYMELVADQVSELIDAMDSWYTSILSEPETIRDSSLCKFNSKHNELLRDFGAYGYLL